jgi:hypothetical protein
VVRKLAEKAALFVEYTRRRGLSMNASKKQLLLSSHAGNVSETTVEVDGNTIHPGDVIELLGQAPVDQMGHWSGRDLP